MKAAALTPALLGVPALAGCAPGWQGSSLNLNSDTALQGRTIRVDGEARRVRIDFLAGGRPTGKYYYQTHVVIERGEQLRSVD